MSDTPGSFVTRGVVTACFTVLFAVRAAAQIQQPVVVPAPTTPEFLARYEFHLSAAALAAGGSDSVPPDKRFSWDTHFGGSLDIVDYVTGRLGLVIDYQAVLGNEYRPFDPNQGNYTLETSSSVRVGATEVAGVFHHVSRHISDRPKRFAIAWNDLGVRVLRRVTVAGVTVDAELEGMRLVQHSYVDYTWTGELNLMVRRPLTARVGAFAHGTGQMFGVDGSVPRSTQSGGAIEAGLRVNGRAGALEVFVGFEKRVDADPLDRQAHRWGLAGFRLLSR